jgi:hypothetical protein
MNIYFFHHSRDELNKLRVNPAAQWINFIQIFSAEPARHFRLPSPRESVPRERKQPPADDSGDLGRFPR